MLTGDTKTVVGIRESCQGFLTQLYDAIEAAVEKNGEGMSNTSNAGVSHGAILDAVWNTREALRGYGWECEPGRWLIYTLLALPAGPPKPSVALLPKRQGIVPERDLHGMLTIVPALPEEQYSLPEAVGQLFSSSMLRSCQTMHLLTTGVESVDSLRVTSSELELLFCLSEKLQMLDE